MNYDGYENKEIEEKTETVPDAAITERYTNN
jgi:hypothetical protein